MTTPPSSEFSYDLYPGLDADLEAALARNIANGATDPAQLATAGLANAVGNILNLTSADYETKHWADVELYTAASKWYQYDLGTSSDRRLVPHGFNSYPGKEQFARLFEAKQQISNSGFNTPKGTPIGETMKLVLVPWQLFKDNLGGGGIETMLRKMRQVQGVGEDFIQQQLLLSINDNVRPMYRNPTNPALLMTAGDYLNMKIAQDGPWGVMLAQTSNDAGIEQYCGKSSDELTFAANGHGNLILNLEQVDQMGIFEWWALTLQEDPSQLSKYDDTLLLANRFHFGAGLQIPSCDYLDGHGRSHLTKGDIHDELARPRLAVM